jgi:hypothetical protein
MPGSGSLASFWAWRTGDDPSVKWPIDAAHGNVLPLAAVQPDDQVLPGADAAAPRADVRNGPVIIMSYAYSGAEYVQDALAACLGLACTSGTGIIPMCAAAAETWQRIEGRSGPLISRLAATSIRGLVTAQVAVILADAGKKRWCELTTASSGTVESFLQLFPNTTIVCVHRSCLEVVSVGVQASPWGLQSQALVPFLQGYPGNNVAALAAYWVNSARQLLAFEKSHPEIAHRVRYEDVTSQPERALATIREAQVLQTSGYDTIRGPLADSGSEPLRPGPTVPIEMIPESLRERIASLQAELRYLPLER